GFTVVSGARIHTSVPSGATTGRISVTTPAGTATSANSFTVTSSSGAPTITSFTPNQGPVGTGVVIEGTNFGGASPGQLNCRSAGFSVVSSTRIQTSVPSGATSGRISVTTPAGTATSANSFTVTQAPQAPQISSFTPSRGPAGTVVSVNGAHFTGATAVRL